jgi:predicted nucleic acid-binding protein
VRFWDSSAIVPLIVQEAETARRGALLEGDSEMTRLECASAVNRLHREGTMDEANLGQALQDLGLLAASWFEVEPTEAVRSRALRLLRVHPLRAADSLQLAAALVATGENPAAFALVTNDERLREAALKEGFVVE